ncbi:hypothetical protein OG884_03060 [Streptosporangium sp. NBC_01755]|uniref:hypothetical protein n=1 Tax=unclassified Streptosporangium TaxID=2632669 RepID=UPI002DD86300|nr:MULTISPECIES: hypothetical protein [unclassified Streptosporangium]WSA27595.1 hypothetical protein OIE13_06900 [Streptosporangium sp. NBC_01810]WSD00935.1 hypothetical protein OG884_03060 [Streptosporangium sp. NBC_01755]
MTTTNKTAPPLGKTPATLTSGSSSAETAEIPVALAAMMSEDEAVAAQAEAARWRYGFYVVIVGLVVILIGFAVITLRGGDTTAPFAGLVGVSGAIIGAYFGVQVGQSGKDRVEAELRRTNEIAIRLAAKVHAHDADSVINTTMGPRRR